MSDDSPSDDTQPTEAEILAALLRRLGDKPGFSSMSDSIAAINEITNAEDQNIDDLVGTIVKDFGLTSSILRVANSATYRVSSSGVTTVSRAINLLGFSTLREIALTVTLFSQMKDRSGAREIKDAFLRAHLAGSLAREAGRLFLPKNAEEVYVYALIHSIGRILTLLYFADEVRHIHDLIEREACSEEEAAQRVLGVGYARLGQAVAEQWRFPTSLVRSLQPLPAGPVQRPKTSEDTLWMLSGFGNELSAILCTQPKSGETTTPSQAGAVSALKERFASVMMFAGTELQSVVKKSFEDTRAFAGTLGVSLSQSDLFHSLHSWVEAGTSRESKYNDKTFSEPVSEPIQITDAAEVSGDEAQAETQIREHEYSALTAGISKLSNAIVSDFKLRDIYRMTLDVMWEAMDFQRVLMCVRDEDSGYMIGQMGCGKDAAMLVRKFRFPLKDSPNVFQLAISNGLDIVIKDIADPQIADKIPPWYRSMVSARTFTLMPLVIKGKSVAMIYGDKQEPNSIAIADRELALLKTLRNQAVLAIKHSDGE